MLSNPTPYQKSQALYSCKSCDYNTSNKKDYTRHLQTQKHSINAKKPLPNHDGPVQNVGYVCKCGKKYMDNSGLWRHKKKCSQVIKNVQENDLIMNLITQNQELQKQIIEMMKNGNNNTITNNNNTNINNNSNNKTFNLQLFLNETCKDAMNITDFVNSIQLQLTDFENIGEQGYINGISNLIIKNLKALDENMRPVHCSDLKRESIYVKDNNTWEKDTNDNQKLKKAIRAIAHKNTKMIPKYREKYPDSQFSYSKYSDNYNKFVLEAMGGSGDNDDEKTEKIMKRIVKEIVINK